MNVNIEAIEFFKVGNDYEVYTEFADYPVGSFKTEEDAISFIIGYQKGIALNSAMLQGQAFRKVIQDEVNEGIQLEKRMELGQLVYA